MGTDWERLGGWTDLLPGGGDESSIAATAWGPDRLDVFGLVKDERGYKVIHKAWDGRRWDPAGVEWRDLGGIEDQYPRGPVVASRGPNRLDVFIQASDSSVWHKEGDGREGWLGWTNLGGQ